MPEQTGGFPARGSLLLLEKCDQFSSTATGDVEDTPWGVSTRSATGVCSGTSMEGGKNWRNSSFQVHRPPALTRDRVERVRPAALATSRLCKGRRTRWVLGMLRNGAQNPTLPVEKGVRERPVIPRQIGGRSCRRSSAVLAGVQRGRYDRRAPAGPLRQCVFSVGDFVVNHAEGGFHLSRVVHRVFVGVGVSVGIPRRGWGGNEDPAHLTWRGELGVVVGANRCYYEKNVNRPYARHACLEASGVMQQRRTGTFRRQSGGRVGGLCGGERGESCRAKEGRPWLPARGIGRSIACHLVRSSQNMAQR